jgi:hypothetical protein
MSFIEIFNGLQKGLLIRKEDVSPEVLKRIQAGTKQTKALLKELTHFFDYF